MKDFKTGDIVRLINSDTKMTVRSVNRDKVICNWFKDSDLQTEEFERQTLTLC